MPDIVGILLAAGQSTRFGKENKLLVPLANGTPLVIAAAQPLLANLPRVIAVIPPNTPKLDALLVQHDLEIIHCIEPTSGMGANIACGVRASADADGWVIGLGDMPRIPPELVGKVVAALNNGKSLVRPWFSQHPGHPVAFSKKYRAELLQLNSDTGGKSVLDRHASDLHRIPLKTDDSQFDIDIFADVRSFSTNTDKKLSI